MKICQYDPAKHDLQYDDERQEIIFIIGDDIDISCRVRKDQIADVNNVIVEGYGDDERMFIDGEFADTWMPSVDQMLNVLREAERRVFMDSPYKLELNVEASKILDNFKLVAFAHAAQMKVNISQKEAVYA